MSRRNAVFGAACVLWVTASALDASAFCRQTTEGDCDDDPPTEIGEFFEWDRACISYAIDVRGSQWMSNAEVEEAVDLAFEEWENVDCGEGNPPNIVFQPFGSSTCRRAEYNCNGNVNTIGFLDPWQEPCSTVPYPSDAFAVTTIWRNPRTGEIFDTDMLINDQAHIPLLTAGGPYANCPDDGCPPASGRLSVADLRSIVTHEIGHMLGLGHSEVREATMFFSTTRGSIEARDLHPDDIEAICSVYPPGNLDQSCDATPLGGLELDCEQKECTDRQGCTVATRSGGCSAARDPDVTPLGGILAALLGLIALRRLPKKRAVGS